VIRPVERWTLSRGGNPASAPWWLFGIGLAGAIIVVTLSQWIQSQIVALGAAQAGGARGLLRLVIYYAGQLVLLAIIVRVIGSWFGAGRYNRWTRWSYVLSDWIVEPLRRVIPPLGIIDISPIVAWFILQIALSLILGALR
jgi:YggT family protein